jgi:hypothetical protein
VKDESFSITLIVVGIFSILTVVFVIIIVVNIFGELYLFVEKLWKISDQSLFCREKESSTDNN